MIVSNQLMDHLLLLMIKSWSKINDNTKKLVISNSLHVCYQIAEYITIKGSIVCLNRKHYTEPRRVSALVGTIYFTHRYFTASRWRTPAEVYFYFRESILHQSVESPPKCTEIFEPEEAKEALLFFFETYLRNLPLIGIMHLPHYKLRLSIEEENRSLNEKSGNWNERRKT